VDKNFPPGPINISNQDPDFTEKPDKPEGNLEIPTQTTKKPKKPDKPKGKSALQTQQPKKPSKSDKPEGNTALQTQQPKKLSKLEKWYLWIGLIAGVCVIITFILTTIFLYIENVRLKMKIERYVKTSETFIFLFHKLRDQGKITDEELKLYFNDLSFFKEMDKKKQSQQLIREMLISEAWGNFNNENYQEAIALANKVIDEHKIDAIKEQEILERTQVPLPPRGRVPDEVSNEEKTIILQRGLLNDVATCWFIKGRSFERLGNTREAIRAYSEVERYPHARIWDESWPGFWSPAEKAQERRTYLQQGNTD